MIPRLPPRRDLASGVIGKNDTIVDIPSIGGINLYGLSPIKTTLERARNQTGLKQIDHTFGDRGV
jgi:hypothetical protein